MSEARARGEVYPASGAMTGASLDGLPHLGRLVVGFSGGADSTALSFWLMGQVKKDRIILAHVNHMLRGGEANQDEAFCRDFAEKHGLRLEVLKIDVGALAAKRGVGTEECGRQVRYQFFARLAPGEDDRILTAHNAEDNAETMILNLCRGAGLEGLCGIPERRGKIIRPLLRVSRGEIEAFCYENGLGFVTDSSNLKDDYTRNRLRHHVMPVLMELNPRFVRAAGTAAELLQIDRDFLLEQAKELLARSQSRQALQTRPLLEAHEAIRGRALKMFLENAGCGRLEKKHLDTAEAILRDGGRMNLPGGVEIWCAQGMMWASTDPGNREPQDYEFTARLGENLLPDGRILLLSEEIVEKYGPKTTNNEKIQNLLFKNAVDCDIMNRSLGHQPPVIRNRRPKDRFAPLGRGLSKPIKQIFQECRVPVPQRAGLPLLVCKGEIAWCPKAGASEKFKVKEDAKRILTVRLIGE